MGFTLCQRSAVSHFFFFFGSSFNLAIVSLAKDSISQSALLLANEIWTDYGSKIRLQVSEYL